MNLAAGGQGKVYRVIDVKKFDELELRRPIQLWIENVTHLEAEEKIAKGFREFGESIINIGKMANPSNHGALKILHKPEDARDATLASERIKREIEAMVKISHPNILKILDSDKDAQWHVSQYHHRGSLIKNVDVFKGKFIESLRAIRPLVEGVALLHKNNIVHRDIKPENVFFNTDGNLILGDFGLVFFIDEHHSRISATWENVGSRDWMPAWAMGMRIEDIKPSFDIFCIGKLLWSMISGSRLLRLWYFDRPQFNLESLFPDTLSIEFANPLLKKCIVEDEHNCLPDGAALLAEIEKVLRIIDVNADLIGDQIRRRCKVCGIGTYRLTANKNISDIRNFGFNPTGRTHI